MVIYLAGETEEQEARLDEMTPRQIVAELDKHVVGQNAAKRAVAIALRNRVRRKKLAPDLAADVIPKNIIMIGSTGVGKTEIARRLARMSNSPFLKVEASRFTEVGYVGRDVESMVRDLTEIAVDLVRQEKRAAVRARAEQNAEERLLQLLLPPPPRGSAGFQPSRGESPYETQEPSAAAEEGAPEGQIPTDSYARTRDKLRRDLQAGLLEDRIVEIEVESSSSPTFQIFGAQGLEEMGMNLKDMMPGLFGGRRHPRKLKVSEAREILTREEEDKLLDPDQVTVEALERVEQSGILFIDEIDKVAGRESGHGPDVSREGVQRDLLPIIEGTTVNTRYGMIRTDHILFIAAGAFHVTKPSDLIPELQGRLPIRVELQSLKEEDFIRILTKPKNALIKQYVALLETEGVKLNITEDTVASVARFATSVNEQTENIGARRLHTILEKVLDELSFEAPDLKKKAVKVDAAYVNKQLADIVTNQDLSRYIL